MATDDGLDAEHLPDDLGEDDVPTAAEVSSALPDAGTVSMEVHNVGLTTSDVVVVPIRERTVEEDVEISFDVGKLGNVGISLSEDEAHALMDCIHQALNEEPLP